MNTKTLITLLTTLTAGLFSLNATAAAVAYATVTANIVAPPVTVSMPESIMMAQVSNDSLKNKEGISLSSGETGDAEKFNIKSSGSLAYSMAVSSKVNVTNRAGNKMSIKNFSLPSNTGYVTSDSEHELHMNGALEGTDSNNGPYTGQIYLTANFN